MNQRAIQCFECLRVGVKCHFCEVIHLVDGIVREAREAHGWELEGEWMPLKKPGGNGEHQSAIPVDPSSAGFLTTFKDLTEFLCSQSWADGSPRERGTLLLCATGGKWQLKVRDPSAQRYAFYTARTLEEALLGLDMGLAADDLDWRLEKGDWKDKKR